MLAQAIAAREACRPEALGAGAEKGYIVRKVCEGHIQGEDVGVLGVAEADEKDGDVG